MTTPNHSLTAGEEKALRRCSMCQMWCSKPCGEGCYFSLRDPTWEQYVAREEAIATPRSTT
jgi:hypothetical protein